MMTSSRIATSISNDPATEVSHRHGRAASLHHHPGVTRLLQVTIVRRQMQSRAAEDIAVLRLGAPWEKQLADRRPAGGDGKVQTSPKPPLRHVSKVEEDPMNVARVAHDFRGAS